jgi:hypothetical protein
MVVTSLTDRALSCTVRITWQIIACRIFLEQFCGNCASFGILEADDRQFGKRRAAAAISLTPELHGVV